MHSLCDASRAVALRNFFRQRPASTNTNERYIARMRALCVGRHSYLSGHLCKYFSDLAVETYPAVGLDQAADLAREHRPDFVICDYDLITPSSLDQWGADADL